MTRTTSLHTGSIGWMGRGIIAVAFRRRFYNALIAIIAILVAVSVRSNAEDGPAMIVGHSYVCYSGEHVPSGQGTPADITTQVTTDQDGHTFDLYGNQLFYSGSDSYIRNANGQIVGFVYATSP